MPAEISILIVTHNSAGEIGACLGSIQRCTRRACEVILVDNASSDGTVEAAARVLPARIVGNGTNVGFAAAVNQASRLASGRYLLLLNPDTVVHNGAVDRLADFLDSQPSVGICAPRILATDGCIRHNCFFFETPWSFFLLGVCLGPLNRLWGWMLPQGRWNFAADWPQEVEAVTGAAMMLRSDLSKGLDGLDERFFMYCEDGDLCYRAQQQGWKTMFVPAAVVTHSRGASTPAEAVMLNGMIGEHLLHSRYAYTRKYFGPAATGALRMACWLAGLGFVLAAGLPFARRRRLYEHGVLLLKTRTPQGTAP